MDAAAAAREDVRRDELLPLLLIAVELLIDVTPPIEALLMAAKVDVGGRRDDIPFVLPPPIMSAAACR